MHQNQIPGNANPQFRLLEESHLDYYTRLPKFEDLKTLCIQIMINRTTNDDYKDHLNIFVSSNTIPFFFFILLLKFKPFNKGWGRILTLDLFSSGGQIPTRQHISYVLKSESMTNHRWFHIVIICQYCTSLKVEKHEDAS